MIVLTKETVIMATIISYLKFTHSTVTEWTA